MASECPAFIQTIDEFVYSSKRFRWQVDCSGDHRTFKMCSQHIPADTFIFYLTFERNDEKCVIGIEFQSTNRDLLHLSGTTTKASKTSPWRHHISVLDENDEKIEEIKGTTYKSSDGVIVRAPSPELQKLLEARQTRRFTLECCIQILEYPTREKAEKIVMTFGRMATQRRCESALKRDFHTQYKDKNMTADVTLRCQDGDVRAHKLILISRWPAIAKMFDEKLVSFESLVIDVSDTESQVIEKILLFIYTGEYRYESCNINTRRIREGAGFETMLAAADKYGLDDLSKAVCDEMWNQFTIGNALEMLTLSQKYSARRLEESALSKIKYYSFLPYGEARVMGSMSDAHGRKPLDLNAFRKIYEMIEPHTNEFQQSSDDVDEVTFTWEIDSSADLMMNNPILSSKKFPLQVDNNKQWLFLEIRKGASDIVLFLGCDVPEGRFLKIWAEVSISGSTLDSICVSQNMPPCQICKIMEMPQLLEKINEEEGKLDIVTIACRFQTLRGNTTAMPKQSPKFPYTVNSLALRHNESSVEKKVLRVIAKNFGEIRNSDTYKSHITENPEIIARIYKHLIKAKTERNNMYLRATDGTASS